MILARVGDEVALMFAMLARVSGPTFKTSLEQVARSVGIVQDYRHAEVPHRVEAGCPVLPPPSHPTPPALLPALSAHRVSRPAASTLTTR